jgi:hypothetical protein
MKRRQSPMGVDRAHNNTGAGCGRLRRPPTQPAASRVRKDQRMYGLIGRIIAGKGAGKNSPGFSLMARRICQAA